ncbi:MMPL family transporter [Granulicoccus sp. GXG6511]|uniref:MMPL family transporter n=1 Tax=Granulicoccus sp. GXG6511 TaxID=3381351 RepID=UPI003D7EA1E8
MLRTPGATRADHSSTETDRSGWAAFGRFVSGRFSWLLLVAALLVSGALMGIGSGAGASSAPNSLPDDAEAARVTALQQQFPDAGVAPSLAVFTRADGGELTPADLGAAAEAKQRMLGVDRGVAEEPQGPPVIPSEDGRAALATVMFDAEMDGVPLNEAMQEVRAAANDGLPAELTVQVTGGPAFGADLAAAFEGADFTLLAAAALVVAVLLLITYRSPILWIVPLLVVGIADRTAAIVATRLAEPFGFTLDGSTTGITSVLIFGAGTNYALLLVSRYREELRRQEDHRKALAIAVRYAGPAILASNVTVVLALLTLLAATLPNTRVLGFAGAVGLLVALAFGLLVLPPALALCRRGLFWPFIPRPGDKDRSVSGGWFRLASAVSRRPVLILLATVPILAVLTAGILGTRIGLEQTEQFRVEAESAKGFETLRTHYPPGLSGPTTVLARTDAAAQVDSVLGAAPGVEQAQQSGQSDTGLTRWRVVLEGEPASTEAFETIERLRADLAPIAGAEALVGGPDAQQLDSRNAAQRDLFVILPMILGVVLIVLFLLLRALWAPLLLIITTTLSSFAALGAGTFVSTRIFGFPALDVSVPLFAFLFLIALGVDYTIFLVTRAQEETPAHGTRQGMVRAVAVTGGVITSAGVVLAAVFVVLGVLPLITLTQLGIVVGIGILLDTFVVRTIVIPALFTIVGRHVWWPSKLARVRDPEHTGRTADTEMPETA